ncbi:response regulator [Chitinophaga polysaccharea]|uniref:hybrid sensor histidine kinase/response regulator transcription factor n=1 Tax=Chitinophaga polysaccharea TaxID=1293035 RepID=UPI001455274D|nr:hybrid sensor histidine kinase/response regulator transcription factor [Chitinophaga polysaccharea]NLR57422.1 response regulator [Chitinophaga polysaccharea]
MRKLVMCCLLFLGTAFHVPGFAAGDNRYYVISYLGIEQGLSNNAVRCVFQDHKGFMWFGTYDGLNRYDGNVFKVFRNRFNDSSSLVNNWVFTINEDLQYKLWIGTRQGINIYDNVSGKFSSVQYRVAGTTRLERVAAVVRDIKRDGKGNMLIGTENLGLLFCPAGTYTAVQLPLSIGSQRLTSYDAGSIEIAGNGDVWCFVQGRGLCRLNKNASVVNLVNGTFATADCIRSDRDLLWIGTPNGLLKYSVSSNQYQESFTEENGKLSYNKVLGLYLDKHRRLWIATNGGGINIIRTEDGTPVESIPAGNSNNTLASASVSAIYEDTDGRKWIGTLRGGVNIIDPKKDRFQSVLHDPLNSNSLVSNFIYAFCEEKDGTVWVGTDGGGISRWQRKTAQFTNFSHQPGVPASLSDNFVTNVRCDNEQHIWVSTFWGGINRFDRKTNTFRHYSLVYNSSQKESKTVYLLYEDSYNTLWAGTFGRGALSKGALYQYDRQQDTFKLADDKLTDLFTMKEDSSGQLWAGNLRSLIKIDPQHHNDIFYPLGNPVRAIHEDRNGRFWVGTEGGGLLLFDRTQGKILERYTTAEGLCNNAVLNILEDETGDLWISTFYGISRFNTRRKIFTNFYQGDGLSSNQFNYNAALQLQSGELMFGGIKGLNIFRPSNILASRGKLKMLFTDIHINNMPIGQRTGYIEEQQGDDIRKIKVPYREAVLTFDFTALDYSTAEKISYAYYMEGWDKNWNYTGNTRTATYTHLAAGQYTFRVKSTNAEGQWIDNEISLTIIVLSPWYASWWAYLLYLFIVIALAAVYITYQTKQRRLRYEVALANLNTEKERELNEKKIAFFTNVSHEFRTPLTLIINPVKDLMLEQDPDGKHRRELTTIYRNARRLLRLLDQLLLFRRADSDIDKLKPARVNFTELCRDVFQSFESQAQSGGLIYSFDSSQEEVWITGDREKLEIILFNLLSNAFKYTPAGGSIAMKLYSAGNQVAVTIADTGCGIPAGSGNHIFEKFYRSEESGSAEKPGFGIGLYLVKKFMELHQGIVSFESREGGGTLFTVALPCGTDQLSEEPSDSAPADKTSFLKAMTAEKLEDISPEEPEEEAISTIITSRQTMLIVDDDAQIRQYISGMFRSAFNIEEASNGKEGLEKAVAMLPDVVISDIRMETMSGLELCKEIKQNTLLNHIPVILLTGSSAEEGKLASAEVGSDYYITKPFEKELLIATVHSVLQTRDNLRNYFLNEVTLRKNDFKVSGQYKEFVEKCIAIVEANLDNDEFNIKVLAREIGMSYSSVYKKIRLVSGESLRGFVRFIRLRKAAELMINTSLNVNEIGFQVGINDVKYFREQFNKVFGMNPSGYIRRYRKVFEDKYKLEKIETRKKESGRKKV